MLEVSPVLSGQFDTQPVTPVSTANAAASATAAASVDPRRYTQWDRTATEVHTDGTMSFGDFLDMINPLQHIPIVSSVYRAASGDTINPVSRIAGDILYGGAFGVASALMGGVGAIGDSVMQAATGKDSAGTMVAALFGDDKKAASPASATPNPIMLASAATSPASAAAGNAASAPSNAPSNNALSAKAFALNNGPKAFSLNRNPLPFGGVMTPVNPGAVPAPANMSPAIASNAVQNNPDTVSTAIALNEGSHGVRIGNTIYTNTFLNGSHTARAVPTTNIASATPSAASQASTISTGSGTTPAAASSSPLPQALLDDVAALRSLGKYNTTASGAASLGANLNLTN